ncbi:SAM-dependent methyltransferase [Myxacorys almedinensis]|uniref:Methyltransferase domain-containing protein n=1 Tax=Myxacorys almedinensis A TaxID=2690445 RepID=A0A8J8CK09_9CYAN|nr:class I SAM-dependent methyltransferase [Myxacorys almedinensis]NDJ16160.1 methyltransferase domain-containing protein [Myxacorys almedinensis A]
MLLRRPDVGFIPTPDAAIEAMLSLADVTASDILYDLGSGDGRILITAAQRYGTRGVGIDIDPVRVAEARSHGETAGVCDRVSFHQADLFESEFQTATIVVLYLLPHLNLKLRPRLLDQLKPGTQLLSLDFDMGDWLPDRVIKLDTPDEESTLYYWRVPETLPKT